ncbi:small nuclear ribonucleoprotein polypeptide B [Globomyces pollinis-pini]|nr:small nuclear ribonucleoprotein polypeptide B [Globomyces pollinis-pini]
MAAIPPNQTLYVNGINEKIGKQELRRSLYFLFSQHGKVIDVVALKTIKQRGQAFVCFEEIQGATTALRALQGFPMYDKPLKIHYAKTESNIVKVRNGTFLSRKTEKRELDDLDDEDEADRKRQKQLGDDDDTHILFVSNLPPTVTQDSLTTLFQQYPGFKEVRDIPGRPDIAFVDYSSQDYAMAAKDVLNGFQISATHSMVIEFAKT